MDPERDRPRTQAPGRRGPIDHRHTTLVLRVLDTTMSPLWAFGWFDRTRFRVDGPPTERQDARQVLREFLRDPLSQCSVCDRGTWGAPIQRHGPFLHGKLAAEWYRRVDPVEFSARIRRALHDPRLGEPPEHLQRLPFEAWVEAVRARSDALFALEAPDEPKSRVDWDFVWIGFYEFVAVSPDRTELAVGVVGCD
jgi:hypothetical protein